MICIVKSRGTKSSENNLVLFDKVHFIEEGKVRNIQFHLLKMGSVSALRAGVALCRKDSGNDNTCRLHSDHMV